MTASPNTTMDNNRRVFAFLALGLLLAALLVPILTVAFGRQEFALPFSVVAGLLGLLFGTLSWSDRIGGAVTITLLSVFVVTREVWPWH